MYTLLNYETSPFLSTSLYLLFTSFVKRKTKRSGEKNQPNNNNYNNNNMQQPKQIIIMEYTP